MKFDHSFRICWISSSILCDYGSIYLKAYRTLAYKLGIYAFEAPRKRTKLEILLIINLLKVKLIGTSY